MMFSAQQTFNFSNFQVSISISQYHEDHNNIKINKYYQATWWWELKKYLPNLSTPNTYETFPKAQRTLKHHAICIFKITIVTCCQLLSSCPKILTWCHQAVDDLAGIKLAAIKPLSCCCPAVKNCSQSIVLSTQLKCSNISHWWYQSIVLWNC